MMEPGLFLTGFVIGAAVVTVSSLAGLYRAKARKKIIREFAETVLGERGREAASLSYVGLSSVRRGFVDKETLYRRTAVLGLVLMATALLLDLLLYYV